MAKILPCPICGNTNLKVYQWIDKYAIYDCEFEGDSWRCITCCDITAEGDTEEAVIATWNKLAQLKIDNDNLNNIAWRIEQIIGDKKGFPHKCVCPICYGIDQHDSHCVYPQIRKSLGLSLDSIDQQFLDSMEKEQNNGNN